MAKRDYYDILGVSKTASADEIRKAHRKLARQFHPDMNKNNPAATEKFKEVQEAYDVLSDGEKRKKYDQFGHAGPDMGGGWGGPPPGAHDPFEAFRRAGGTQGGQWRAGGGRQARPQDFGGGGMGEEAFASIFEQMFGGAGAANGGGRATQAPANGEDIDHTVQLTFEQAARGTTLPLRMQVGGNTETIEIKIPPGMADGGKIRVKGKGQPSPSSRGKPGDLYIICKVAPHPVFRREGLDIYADLPVSVYDALLGGKATVQTLDGEVTMTVPPGTSSGSKLRIKGRGITRGEETGDQYAVIKILVPKELPANAKSLVEELRKLAPL